MSVDSYPSLLENVCSLSTVYPCQYFPGRSARMRYFHCDQPLKGDFVDFLLSRGFRRCGALYYVYACPDCRACIPYRLPVSEFSPNRNQNRIRLKNAHVRIVVSADPAPDEMRKRLYLDYYRLRHDGFNRELSYEMTDEEVIEAMQGQMYTNFGNTLELSYYENATLIAFTTVDAGADSLSAVYTAFDPKYSRQSPGGYSILSMINFAKDNGMKYLYLGLYIKGHPKMDYKSGYAPAEIMYEDGNWRKL